MRYIVLFYLIFVTVTCHFASCNNQEIRYSYKDLNTNFKNVYEKLEYLEKNCAKCGSIAMAGNMELNEVEINTNIKQMMDSVGKVNETREKIELLDRRIDKRWKEMDHVILLLTKIDERVNSCATKIELNEVKGKCTSTCQPKKEKTKRKLKLIETNNIILSSGVCYPNPCLNGGQCRVTASDYICVNCPNTTIGKNCEGETCKQGDRCFQSNETTYVVYENDVGFYEARKVCADHQMVLVMPKEKESTEFVVGHLRSMYGEENGEVRFWFGLKYNMYAGRFDWMDGSPLENYTGGRADFKNNTSNFCGILHLQYGSTMWFLDGCRHSAYTLCEKRNAIN